MSILMPQMSLRASVGRPVVIDTDMAADDLIAILFLLHCRDIEVEAITVAGTGEVHGEPGVRHAAGLVALAGAGEVPVACGRDTPLRGSRVFPSAWRRDADGLYGLSLPGGTNPASGRRAAELLASVVESASGRVSLLTLGPLTNVAEALQDHPQLASKLEIYTMGGAVEVPGNVANTGGPPENETAEWNIFIDPAAANVVFGSGASVTLVPLDATDQVPLTRSLAERIRSRAATPSGAFTAELVERILVEYPQGLFMWDSLAAAILADDRLATFNTAGIAVVEDGPQAGRTVPSAGGPRIRVAREVDAPRFERMLIDTINAPGRPRGT
jgi:inosine-uridine nucleoside N-ribohydrolase